MRVIIDTDDIRQQLKEIVTADNVDTLVEVMRILEKGKKAESDIYLLKDITDIRRATKYAAIRGGKRVDVYLAEELVSILEGGKHGETDNDS